MALRRSCRVARCFAAAMCIAAMACAAADPADEQFGSAANPTGDPVGGGEGYRDIFDTGDFVVRTAAELTAALKAAGPGQVVFVPDGVEIDLTGRVGLTLGEGVTLAGARGAGGSPGPRLFTTHLDTSPLFRTGGAHVRITGLRIEGPFAGTERIPTLAVGIQTNHYATRIDNCEIYNWNYVGVAGRYGAANLRVHHCFIHHCQRGGLGYGISLDRCDLFAIANVFQWCRHHIAASGAPGCAYEAAYNHVLPGATSHYFDMHGGRDRGDGTDIAGDWMRIHHNTFEGEHRAVVIRGAPAQGAEIHNNWFAKPAAETVVSGGNTRVYRNVHGPDRVLEE